MPFDSDDPLVVQHLDGHFWKLKEDFAYVDPTWPPKGWRIDVPAGFVTDFASVPRGLWNVLPPTGDYGKAAVIHDYLYATGRNGEVPVTRAYTDGVFLRAMADLGVGRIRRWTMYLAVRSFAGRLWDKRRAADAAPKGA